MSNLHCINAVIILDLLTELIHVIVGKVVGCWGGFSCLVLVKNYKQCCGCYQSVSVVFSCVRVSSVKMLAELLSVLASNFCFCFKENSNFTESSCKACGSTEEANNCVEVIVTNESTSCTCPSSGTLLSSPKIKKGMLNIIALHCTNSDYFWAEQHSAIFINHFF